MKKPRLPRVSKVGYRELARGARLLRELSGHYGITTQQQRAFLYLLAQDQSTIDALQTVVGLIAVAEVETPARVARAGLSWLNEMLAQHHAKELERPVRLLAKRGCTAPEIAETLNDCGYDDSHNGRQPFGELQVRALCRVLGIKLQPVRWT